MCNYTLWFLSGPASKNKGIIRTALVAAYLHECTEGEQKTIVDRLMADKKTTPAAATAGGKVAGGKVAASKCLPSVLQLLTAEPDFDKFAALKMAVDDEQREEIILKREGHHHEKAGELTPRLIKDLRPKVAGCYLNWQPSLNQFAAYFKRPPVAESSDKKRGPKKTKQPKMHSTARVYGGKWTQIQALSLVVAQLWRWHVKYGGES